MDKPDLTFSQAIEKVLLDNNYSASLKKIYKEFEKYRPLTGKTPYYSIQERVQRDPRFTRIGLGVYALTEYLEKLPKETVPKSKEQEEGRLHYRIQGMLLEIGAYKDFETYSPNKKAIFNNRTLSSIMTFNKCPNFTYPRVISKIQHIDVLWINERGYPKHVFEVEISPQFPKAFLKFMELQDFMSSFYIISDSQNEIGFLKEISSPIFLEIKARCKFWSIDQINDLYDKSLEGHKIDKLMFI